MYRQDLQFASISSDRVSVKIGLLLESSINVLAVVAVGSLTLIRTK